MKRVAILGSTGSIGRQTLDVAAQFPEQLRVTALVSGTNEHALARQAAELDGPVRTATYARDGMSAITDIVSGDDVDIVVIAVAGVIGLLPTVAAIRAGKAIALASKEVLVAAGEVVMPLLGQYGVTMTPIDSEHSAIFQCLQGYRADQVESLILTASGGPFRGWTLEQLREVTREQALKHPTWAMGGKITIDSATLMNKGLESIEARWLFGVPIERIEVVVHPQSIVHSMVRLTDGSVLAQMGWPDMRLPIAYALLYPERLPNDLRPWGPTDSPALSFEPVDDQTFRCLALAREAARVGKTMPAILNAANEEAANAFLRDAIGFLRIPEIVDEAMQSIEPAEPELESILETDAQTRAFVRNLITSHSI